MPHFVRYSLTGFFNYLATVAPFLAPFVGGAMFMVSFQATNAAESIGVEVWRFVLTAGLGIFITLVGVIYHNLQQQVNEQSAAIKQASVYQKQLVAALVVIMSNMADGESKKELVAAINNLMELK